MGATVVTARVTEIGSLRKERIPVIISERIMRFLDEGNTGQIVLDVKQGRVMGVKATECIRVDNSAFDVDRANGSSHD